MVFDPKARFTEQVNVPLCMVAEAPLQVTEEMPERESDTLPVTETEEAVNVAPATGDVMEIVGGVLSRLIVTEAGAALPALSIAVPETI